MRLRRVLAPPLRTAGRSRLGVLGASCAAVALLAGGTAYGLAGGTDSAPRPTGATSAATQLTANTPSGCNVTPAPGFARCMSVVRTPDNHRITPNASAPPASALGPADIQSAYKLPSSGGGQTVAIVDAYGYSTAEEDLAVYRAHYNLPPCTTANGCFTKVDQRGGTDYPQDDAGWATETALDLDAVSAACPACNILLIQGDDPSVDNLGAAVNQAVAMGAKYVSNSYGIAGEFAGETSYDKFYDHPGVAVLASSGDDGNVTTWPSTNPNVVSVGGTRLTRDDSTERGWTESAWAAGGSGCSPYEPKPDYQLTIATNCDRRASADIAAVGDPASGLAVYDTLGQPGWLQVGGTSLSSPLVAAMYALAGAPAPDTYPVTYPYRDNAQSAHLFDITAGSNGSCGDVLCTAGPGWDGPTGLGTPNGIGALTAAPHGDIVGHVTNKATGEPVAGATVALTPGGYATRTDDNGDYDLRVNVGTYALDVTTYGYQPANRPGVAVTEGQRTTADFAITQLPHSAVSGKVTDGSGHGWGLYARISVDGYPNGDLFTDPVTGAYSLDLPAPASYTMHVRPVYPTLDATGADGYAAQDITLDLTGDDTVRDVALKADMNSCTAPGYGWNGLSETFDSFTGTSAGDGWSVSGSKAGWRFDNPGNRSPVTNGNNRFAVADSNATGGRLDTRLTSPAVDLRGQSAPHLTFDTIYYGAPRQSATVQVSTDGGKRWTTLWRRSTTHGIGHVDLALPAAAKGRDTRVRFQFVGRDAWWWSVDNVLIGTRECTALPGGLVVGTVSDHDTGAPLTAATVSAEHARTARTAATGDPKAPGGFYRLFVPAGEQSLTAAADGYATATGRATVTAGQAVRHDWSLTRNGSGS